MKGSSIMNTLNITIDDIKTGLKGYMQYSLKNSKENDIKDITLNERMAIVTHYLQNKDTEFAFPFENMAIIIMKDIHEWKMKSVHI